MARMIPIPKRVVAGEDFDRVIRTYSGELLCREQVFPPANMMGEEYVCTTVHLSHSKSWCICYSLVPMQEWDGPVHVFGATDREWVRRVAITGQNWYGFRGTIHGDASAREFVLARKIMCEREIVRATSPTGANYMGES